MTARSKLMMALSDIIAKRQFPVLNAFIRKTQKPHKKLQMANKRIKEDCAKRGGPDASRGGIPHGREPTRAGTH